MSTTNFTLIYGSRRTGKTVLAKTIDLFNGLDGGNDPPVGTLLIDEPDIQKILDDGVIPDKWRGIRPKRVVAVGRSYPEVRDLFRLIFTRMGLTPGFVQYIHVTAEDNTDK